ncbi:unnamed protein product [Owenia fusiformis]|uniref:Thioredoxin-like fold domain-containing protein n=1 Tax=Owenia fusiformis TaxID=6347 RepID=A0A8J1T7J7_OWEFU|nr:unnamed protein product [Owenia fusiformis]
MMTLTLITLMVLAGCGTIIGQLVNIPKVTPGITYGNGSINAPVQIEMFIELNCGDSLLAWYTLMNVTKAFGDNIVRLRYNHFALPYHRNGFLVGQGAYLVQAEKPEKVTAYMDEVFSHLRYFSTGFGANFTRDDILNFLGELAENSTGIPRSNFTRDIGKYWDTARQAWKYGIRQGAAGTPWFYINGLDLTRDPNQPITYEQWVQIINNLISTSDFSAESFSFDAIQSTPVPYLPTQVTPILPSLSGHIYNDGQPHASVTVEMYGELLCPYSKAQWPILKQVADHYGEDRLRLVVHQNPLPYHRNGFLVSQGVLLMQDKKPESVIPYMDAVYAAASNFSTGRSSHMSRNDVIELLSTIANQATSMPIADFKANIDRYRWSLVRQWKYYARLGIAGTPWFSVNSVLLTGGTPSDVEGWKALLDNYVKEYVTTTPVPPATTVSSGNLATTSFITIATAATIKFAI